LRHAKIPAWTPPATRPGIFRTGIIVNRHVDDRLCADPGAT
jgi:hypothetical protein